MTAHGPIYRRAGLILEALAMLGLVGLSRGKTAIWNGFPIDPATFLAGTLMVGFFLWLYGTLAMLAARREAVRAKRDEPRERLL